MIKNNTKNNQKCKKGYKGIGMEGFIARWYAGTVEKDLERFQQDARKISKIVSEGGSVLEVAPGPGYLSIELAKLGNYKITGMDISETFIEIAQNNAKEAKADVEFRRGNVADMPFEDESFDFIFCSSAFKNFSEPVKALSEMYRVLKINGKALIIDLRRDISKKSIEEYVKNMGLSKIDSLYLCSQSHFRNLGMLIKGLEPKGEMFNGY